MLETLDRLDMEGLITSEDQEKVSLLNDFAENLLKEKTSWKEKTKIEWAKEGNVNSKLFHKVQRERGKV